MNIFIRKNILKKLIFFSLLLFNGLFSESISLTLPLFLEKVKENNLQNQINGLTPGIQRAIYKENKFVNGYVGSLTADYAQNKTDAPLNLVPNGEEISVGLGWNYKLLESGTAFNVSLKNKLFNPSTFAIGNNLDKVWRNTLSFRVDQPLLSRGFILNENQRYLDVNKYTAQISESEYNRNYANLISQAILLYWQYQVNLENFKFQQKTLEDNQRILVFNKRKLKLEAISEIEVLENESRIISSEIDLDETKKNLGVLKQNLMIFMGMPLEDSKQVVFQFQDKISVQQVKVEEKEVFNKALNNRDEFKELAIQSESAKNALILGKLGFVPKLDFFLQYDIIGLDTTYSGAFQKMSFGLDKNDLKWGLRLSMFTDIGAYRVPVERPSLLLTQAEKSYALFVENLKKDVRQRVIELKNAYQSSLKNRNNLRIQTKKFKLSTVKYKRGEINFSIHLNNKNSLNLAQVNYLNSKLAYLQATLNLELVQGTILQTYNLKKIPISNFIPFR